MGCWTHFRKTWRPGYGAEVIDPNKAFDFERRLILIRKLCCIFILLAVLVGVICLVASTVNSKNNGNANSNSNNANNSVAHDPGHEPWTHTKEENISIAQVLGFNSLHEDSKDGVVVLTSQSSEDHHNTEKDTVPPNTNSRNASSTRPYEASNLACTTNSSGRECVGLSKAFKTVITFGNGSHTENVTVEGYVLVKMNNGTWHPYCHPNWTLQMGYSLCKGLGFQKLVKLQTIGIEQLKQRVTRLGKDVSFRSERSKSPDLLVLNGTNHGDSKGNLYNCSVGYISCN